jgi:hypothetical protein
MRHNPLRRLRKVRTLCFCLLISAQLLAAQNPKPSHERGHQPRLPEVHLDGHYFVREGQRFIPVGAHWVTAKAAMQWPLEWDPKDIRGGLCHDAPIGLQHCASTCYGHGSSPGRVTTILVRFNSSIIWMSKFLSQCHGYDPHTTGATAVSWFWGLLTAGCFIGMLLLKIFDSRYVLVGTCVGALLCLTVALFRPAKVSVIAFPGIGLFASVMWPILVSLALTSVSEHHGSFAGILSTGIMGGAVVPLIMGRIGDNLGLRAGVAFLYVTFASVLSVGLWAKPLIANATVSFKKAEVQTTG